MIRAHLATYPPRRALMLDIVARMAAQVDRLWVVLNGYDAIPDELRAFPNVEAILPDRDVKDAGKFWPVPDPDDIVFLIDDDLAYPPDYVAATLDRIGACGMGSNVFAYQGNAWVKADGQIRVDNYMFRQPLAEITGAGLVGTGTVCALGRNLPGLDITESAAGFVDIRFASWLRARNVLPWVLPRPFGWLTSLLPREMKADTLYQTVHRAKPHLYMPELNRFATKWPHQGRSFSAYSADNGVTAH